MRKHKSDRIIGLLTVGLLLTGLVVIYAIGPMRANVLNSVYGSDYGENSFFLHQLVSVVIALVVMFLAFKIPYQMIRKVSGVVLGVGILACVVLFVMSWIYGWQSGPLVSCQLGACRWFSLGSSLSVQPAEILKFGLVLYLAGLIAERKNSGQLEDLREFWVPFVLVCGVSLGLVVVIQKDLGTGVSMLAIILAMLFVSGIRLRYFGLVLGAVVILGGIAIVTSPHRMERMGTFLSGEASEDDVYHVENAMIAIGTGGFLGVGFGNSVQATGYLPESINDSVFAVMGETFGFVGLVVIVGCFAWLLLRLLRTANYLQNDEESLVVIGIFAWAVAHVVVNIASMIGLLPLTGITLPLMSYGGTSMLFIAAALGLALQLSCYTSREPREEKTQAKVSTERVATRRRIQ